MKSIKASLILGGIILIIGLAARAASPAELMEKGIYLEETKGELEAASQVYREIVEDANATRNIVAQAQLRLGLCQIKLGNKPQAVSALERLTQQFPDKDVLLALVENSMPQLLDEMVQQIEQNYILQVDRSELMETAIRAVIGKLDSATGLRSNDAEFLSTNVLDDLNIGLEQKVAGIGVVLSVDGETQEMIANPLRHSPAMKAGLKPNDRIVEIDGARVAGVLKLAEVIKLLRGTPGSVVNVTIRRKGTDDLLKFALTRDTIRLPNVKGDHYKPDDNWEFMLDEQSKLGYARVTQMGFQTPKELEAALKELHGRGMKGLILDLRSNPGGSLDAAVKIADLFLDQGTILTVKSRSEEKVYAAKAEGTFPRVPIALLVNRETASAAEIVAACLQDHHLATVVGERTFGQGIVRALFPLKSGGALKLPTSAYYRPSGKNVNRYPHSKDTDDWGVLPDAGFEVTLTEAEIKDFEIDRAARESLTPDTTTKVEFQDRQLALAREYLMAQLRN